MFEFLAGEFDHRVDEFVALREVHREPHRTAGNLAFVGGVVLEECADVAESDVFPSLRGAVAEREHPQLLPVVPVAGNRRVG